MKYAAALTLVLIAAAQDPPRFRSGLDVVSVDVLVTDGGRVIPRLRAEDFELRDSGIVQRIRSVTTGEVPVSMLLALDTSNSVEGSALARLKDASHAALDVLGEDDRTALLTFSNALALDADWAAPGGTIRAPIDNVRAGGATSLYDAAFAALAYSDPAPGRRNLVVLFSDGEDTSSWLPLDVVHDAAGRSESVVYGVTLRPPRPELRLQYRSGIQLRPLAQPRGLPTPLLGALATATGGSATTASSPSHLRETFTSIAREFRSRYILTYTPEGADARGWHPIEVRLTKARGTVTARRGYMK